MRIVVTGGSGRVGSYVVRELVEAAGHEITVFDRVPPSVAGVRWVQGDINDFGEVISLLTGAEAVIHLAAIPVPGGVADHVLFRNNLMGTYNVHEAAARLGIKRVVSTSSGSVLGWTYGVRELMPKYLPINEDHPLAAHDPYGLAKLCGEQIAQSYALKCAMEAVVLRPAWVLVPEISAQLRQRGGATPKRFELYTYIDVRDLATAYRQAVELSSLRHTVLFVQADDSTVGEPLCDLLPRLMPALGDMASTLTGTQPGISNQRAKALLQWQPRFSWRVEQ